MRLQSFYSYILVLTLGLAQFYSQVRETFNGINEYKAQIRELREQAKNERLARIMERENLMEFRQQVATLMPGLLQNKGLGEEGYPYRRLASTVTKTESEQIRKTIARTLFENGKESFRKKDYAKANKAFRNLIEKYGFSSYVTEAYFLLSESLFQESEFEECTTVIQQMVELFPQAELTGFALIRLGRIYEAQNRNEEAVGIYKTVVRSFPQRDVASQAKASLRGLDL